MIFAPLRLVTTKSLRGTLLPGFFFDFWTLTEMDFFTQLEQILKLTQQNFEANSQFRQIQAEFSFKSTKFSQI